jgi:hypothetical protein
MINRFGAMGDAFNEFTKAATCCRSVAFRVASQIVDHQPRKLFPQKHSGFGVAVLPIFQTYLSILRFLAFGVRVVRVVRG